MKIITQEDISAHRQATIIGGLQGLGLSALLCVPSYLLLQRRSALFRGFPLPMKAFLATTITVPVASIAAEKAGERFDRSQWTGIGMQEIRQEEALERKRRDQLTAWESVKDWSFRNKWGIVGTSWAGAMVGSFALVSRNKYQSFSQKLVQARVYAQGLPIALMLVVAILSGIANKDDEVVQLQNTDHSWRSILEQEGVSLKDGEEVKVSHRAAQHSANRVPAQ